MRFLDRATTRLPQPWRTVVDWLATIALAIAFVLVFEAEIAKPYRIPSSSMEPTLHCAKPGEWCLGSSNDRVIANRLAYVFGSPERGQIVVFTAPPGAGVCGSGDGGTTFVKRSDRASRRPRLRARRAVFINGKQLAEPYVDPALRGGESGSWPRVGAKQYFFLGDDRIHSCDSRTWGTVPRSSLIGPVLITYWPPNRIAWH